MQASLHRTKPWGLGLCWGYGEGENRSRGWSWGIFCMEDIDESSTQFLSLVWSPPLVFFTFTFPGRHHTEQMLKLVALEGGCGVRRPGWGLNVEGVLQSTKKRVHPLSWWRDVQASQSCSFLRCSWGPGTRERTGVRQLELGEEKLSSLYFGATRDSKPASWLCKGSHCLS